MQRAALIVFLLIFSGVAAIFAASHFGWPLPWQTAKQDAAPAPPDQRDQTATAPSATTPEAVIKDTVDALGAGTSQAAKPSNGGVELDISRISPDGSSVFAGRAEPDTYVTVYENGKPAGSVKADENGEWSLVTEHKFASADPKLTFEASSTPAVAAATPAPPAKVAAADPQAGAAARSAAAVAGDALKKFENIVSQAREDAKKEAAEQTKTDAAKQEKPAEKQNPPSTADSSSAASSATPNATAGLSSAEKSAPDKQTSTPDQKAADNATTTVIPVPIMFVYNESKLTSQGQRAADLLLEYLTLKHLSAVELTGHADERGTNDYNFDLSRERLDTVSQILRQGGYKGDLKLTPKGKTEPYEGVDRTAYKGEALFQLDRRVELRVTR